MYSWFLLKCNFFPILLLFDCIVLYQTRQLPPHGRSKIREESMQKKSKTQITINWEKKLRKSRCVELQNVISGKRSDLHIFSHWSIFFETFCKMWKYPFDKKWPIPRCGKDEWCANTGEACVEYPCCEATQCITFQMWAQIRYARSYQGEQCESMRIFHSS